MEDVIQLPMDNGKVVHTVIRTPVKTTTWTNYAIIITHGAGGDMNSTQLMNFVESLHTYGFVTVRFTCKPPNFAYRVRCYKAVLEYCKTNLQVVGYVLSGRSMGARVAAQVASDNRTDTSIYGIACVSYPLHQPDRTTELRRSHLATLTRPLFLVSGTEDAMCRKDLMEGFLSLMKCSVTMHWVEGEKHALKTFEKDPEMKDDICGSLVRWCQAVFSLEKS